MYKPRPKLTHEAILTFSETQDPEQAKIIAHDIGVMFRFLNFLPGGEHSLTEVKSSLVHAGPPRLISEALGIDASGDAIYEAIDARLDAGYRITSPLNEKFDSPRLLEETAA